MPQSLAHELKGSNCLCQQPKGLYKARIRRARVIAVRSERPHPLGNTNAVYPDYLRKGASLQPRYCSIFPSICISPATSNLKKCFTEALRIPKILCNPTKPLGIIGVGCREVRCVWWRPSSAIIPRGYRGSTDASCIVPCTVRVVTYVRTTCLAQYLRMAAACSVHVHRWIWFNPILFSKHSSWEIN